MKALSLWDPWGTAMALGIKRIETRGTWVDRITHRGPVAIHVAQKKFKPSDYTIAFLDLIEQVGINWKHLPYGCVIAVGNWVDTVPTQEVRHTLTAQELAFGDYSDGRRALIFENVRRLRTPIRIKGKQGLWNWDTPDDLDDQLLPADDDRNYAAEGERNPPVVIQPVISTTQLDEEEDEAPDAPMPKVHTGSGLLRLDTDDALKLHINDLVGEQIAVLGIKGSGKSYTARLLSESILSYLPMTIVDIDGEYHTLREKFPALEVRGGDHGKPLGMAMDVAECSFRQGISTVLDFSNSEQVTMFDYLVEYFKRLWKLSNRVGDRRPYTVLLEEAHEFVPQSRTTPIKDAITMLAGRGRKRGFTVIYVSQRTEKVDNNAITSSGIYFLHRVMHPGDIRTYADFLPLKPKDVRDRVTALQDGEAIVLRGASMRAVQMRKAETTHGGATPKLVFEQPEPMIQHVAADPGEVAFHALLAKTIHDWGERLQIEVERGIDEHRVTCYYDGRELSYTAPALSEDQQITSRNAASTLWARTSVMWRARTLEGFCQVMSNLRHEHRALQPTDPLAVTMFEEYRRVGRWCLDVLDKTWGNDDLLREQARRTMLVPTPLQEAILV